MEFVNVCQVTLYIMANVFFVTLLVLLVQDSLTAKLVKLDMNWLALIVVLKDAQLVILLNVLPVHLVTSS